MVSTEKLFAVAMIGSIALIFGTAVISIAVILKERREDSSSIGRESNVLLPIKTINNETQTLSPHTQKVVRPFDPSRDLQSYRQMAPDTTSPLLSADAYFHEALRLFGDEYPLGDGGPEFSSNTGLDFEEERDQQRLQHRGRQQKGSGNKRVKIQIGSSDYDVQIPVWISNWKSFSQSVAQWLRKTQSTLRKLTSFKNKKRKGNKKDTYYEAFYYLEKAASMGNSHAQHAMAHVLTTGMFLPTNTSASSYNVSSYPDTNQSHALLLYHMSSIGGNTEAQMAMGWKHTTAMRNNALSQKKDSTTDVLKKENAGVEGRCESALAYYEAAANVAIDELEGGWGRGKVNPSIDGHLLHEMHRVSTGPNVAHHNKPDEQVEALEYFRLRSTSSQGELDVSAAYTLGYYYHFGSRGIEQNLALALHYYEVAAEAGSIEAAGLAATFHLLGIGYDNIVIRNLETLDQFNKMTQGDLRVAYRYAMMGAPGGLEGCTRRHRANSQDEEDCDPDALNALGVLYLTGVPGLIHVHHRGTARKLFMLARDMGNSDAAFHLALLKMGWLKKEKYVDAAQVKKDTELDNDVEKKQESEKLGEENKDEQVAEGEEKDENEDAKEEGKGDVYDVMLPQLQQLVKQLDSMNVNIDIEEVQDLLDGARKTLEENFMGLEDKIEHIAKDILKEGGDKIENIEFKVIDLTKKDISSIANAAIRGATSKTKSRHPSFQEYSEAIIELQRALKKNHLQAKHRLGLIYSHGIKIEKATLIPSDCSAALTHMRDVANGSPTMSRRLRRAYTHYVKGQYEMSLRNYLVAAQAGSQTAQLNAAWLMERGVCLRMGHKECLKNSLKLWTTAARRGVTEAYLRVGDFYYYETLEEEGSKLRETTLAEKIWRRIVYPEVALVEGKVLLFKFIRIILKKIRSGKMEPDETITQIDTCSSSSSSHDKETCKITVPSISSEKQLPPTKSQADTNENLATAALYYRQAAEHPNGNNPQAHFNLGFMHEWGMGVKQDFPLAKRHYDLAASFSSDATIVVGIALWSLNWHMTIMQWYLDGMEKWNEWRTREEEDDDEISEAMWWDNIQWVDDMKASLEDALGLDTEEMDVIFFHVFSLESLLIVLLTFLLSFLVQRRRT